MHDPAVRVDRRAARPQRERQQDRRQEQADRQDDVRAEQEREVGSGIDGDCRAARRSGRPDAPRARPSRPRRGARRRRRPAASNAAADLRLAVDEDPRREQDAARSQLVAERAGQRHEDAGDEVGERRRRTAGRRSAGCRRGRGSGARAVAPGVRGRRLDGDRVGVDADGAAPPRAGSRRWPGSRTRTRRRGRGRRRAPRLGRRAPPASARHSRVVGWSPVPNAMPGSSARTTSSGDGLWRRQVGRMTSRRPTRRTGKYAFQASAQSASWTIRVRSSPIGRSPKAWRWPSASATRAASASAAAGSRAGR